MCIRDSRVSGKDRRSGRLGDAGERERDVIASGAQDGRLVVCLLYTSDAAAERSSVDLGGRRIIKKKKSDEYRHLDTL